VLQLVAAAAHAWQPGGAAAGAKRAQSAARFAYEEADDEDGGFDTFFAPYVWGLIVRFDPFFARL